MIPARRLSRGPLGWMATNPVAANLLMLVMLIGGLLVALQLTQEVFPEFELDIITISVTVPGATPEEVEKGVVTAVEEAVQALDGVKEVASTSFLGGGSVTIELREGVDANIVLQDVKNAVDRITTFPVEAEPPQIALQTTRREVLTLVLIGSDEPLILREWAEIVRDELLQTPGITQVALDGVLDHEIVIEVPQDSLRRYGLTLGDIASRIGQSAFEQGSGIIRAASGDIVLRVNERRDFAREFASVPVLTTPEGGRLLVEDIGTVVDTFADTTRRAEFNGRSAILIDVYRIGEETPASVSTVAMAVVDKLNLTMPGELQLHVLRDDSRVFTERAELLRNNAILGICLVFFCLALFLQPSLAFWVSLGIPVAFIGSFLLLGPLGVSINMMSMFAFIVALGIVVDDAIIVGENVRVYRERQCSGVEASIQGTREVGMPVVFSVLTNMVAFVPILFMPGVMGKIWMSVPLVVITVFACSLAESLFVLPAHLAHQSSKRGRVMGKLYALQDAFSRAFVRLVEYRYGALINWAIQRRYMVVALCLALLIVCTAYVYSGRLGFDLMPRTEADYAYASAMLPSGASEKEVLRIKDQLVHGARKIVEEHGGPALSTGIYASVRGVDVSVRIYLTRPDERPISTAETTLLWREITGELIGVEASSFESDRGGPGSGKGLTIRLSHRDTAVLDRAAEELGQMLGQYANLSDIDTGTSRTVRQFDIPLKPLAHRLGFTAKDIAAQVRSAFEGARALRQQRGRNEVTVRVRLPEDERGREASFENLVLLAPDGREVLLRDVADVTDGRAYAGIRHINSQRTVTIAAAVTPPSAVGMMMQTARGTVLPELMSQYPGLRWEFGGRQSDMEESLGVLYRGLAVALLVIYAFLAVPFKSYTQPLIIMLAIPFGAVGAVGGHLLMGYTLSVISLIGIVALAGVVVNDALVLIDFANRKRAEGFSAREAIRVAGIQRFRPIMLTTLTTFVGLAPMIFETSRQARQLIPVALSLGFGILFASVISLLLVPAFYLILEDIAPNRNHDSVPQQEDPHDAQA